MQVSLVSLKRETGVGSVVTMQSRHPPQGALNVFGDAG